MGHSRHYLQVSLLLVSSGFHFFFWNLCVIRGEMGRAEKGEHEVAGYATQLTSRPERLGKFLGRLIMLEFPFSARGGSSSL